MWRGERASLSSHTNLPTAGDDLPLQLALLSPSLFFVELMMVIWGGSRGRTPYTYLGRYLSCPLRPPPAVAALPVKPDAAVETHVGDNEQPLWGAGQ